jgi:hypothetical protein
MASRRTTAALRQHDAQLREQATDAGERGGALLHKTLAGAVHQQLALLLKALDRHEAHVGPADGLADGCGIGRIVLAALARETVGDDEPGRHQAHGVTELLKLPCPVVGAEQASMPMRHGWERGNEFEQLGAWYVGAHQHGFACGVHTMNGEHVLGEIYSDSDNAHGLPLPTNE